MFCERSFVVNESIADGRCGTLPVRGALEIRAVQEQSDHRIGIFQDPTTDTTLLSWATAFSMLQVMLEEFMSVI